MQLDILRPERPWPPAIGGQMKQDGVGTSFYLRLGGIGVLTYLLHEGAHWITGIGLGYPVKFSLNGVTSAVPMTASDHILFSLSGPALTVLCAVAAFVCLRRDHGLTAYAIIYFAFFMRLLAAAVSVLTPNDEARASELLGLGTWTVPAVVVIGLGAMTVVVSRALRISWKVQLAAYLVSSVVIADIVGLDLLLQP